MAIARRIRGLCLRALGLFTNARRERELAEEFDSHLSMHIDENVRAGMTREEALRQARLKFGGVEAAKEDYRDRSSLRVVETLVQDLRYGLRQLRRAPGLTIAVVGLLALGIGASTTIFSVADAAVFRTLPYPQPERLFVLWGNVKRENVERRGASLPDYADWRDQSRSFESMALFDEASLTITGGGEPERIPAEFAAQPYFQMLGVRPIVGRVYRPEEDVEPLRDAVVVLSERLWKRRFAGNPELIGHSIRLNDREYTVLGVLPDWFRGLTDAAELWVPLHMMGSAQEFADRGSRAPGVLAKLREDVSLTQAQNEMNTISKSLEKIYPATNEGRGVEISPLQTELVGAVRPPLLLLLSAVGLLLVLACSNVVNLLLVRAEGRQREMAVRTALGAGRARVAAQFFVEALLYVGLGGFVGLFAAWRAIPLLITASPMTLPTYVRPSLDWRVMIFAFVVCSVVAVLIGMAPLLPIWGGRLHEMIQRASSRSIDSARGKRYRDALVVVEVAFALVLLVGAGLLLRSMQQLAAIRPGYDSSQVLGMRVALPQIPQATEGAPAPASQLLSARQMLDRLGALPGVQAASLSTDAPLMGASAVSYMAEGQPPVNAQTRPRAYIHSVTPGFFETLRIPILAGRTFQDSELREGSNVAIVSENVAKRFWRGQDPIGKHIRRRTQDPWLTIVGVVNEMKYRGLPNNPTADPDLFIPLTDRLRTVTVMVRTPLNPASLSPSVRTAIREFEPQAVVSPGLTLREVTLRETARPRFTGWLMSIFAVAALVLSVFGLYSVVSQTVLRRQQEIGVRMAIGAAERDVLTMIIRGGAAMVGTGIAIGLLAAFAVTRLMASLLIETKPADPVTFAAGALLLASVGMVACLIPAIRAARIAPASALRSE